MYIEHHGVKGQRWGVRRKSGGVSKASARSTQGSVDARKAAQLKAKPVVSLSNKQLKAVNERMNLEQNYNRMNPSKVAKGRQTANTILATAGIGVAAYNLVKSPAGQASLKAGARVVGKLLAKTP